MNPTNQPTRQAGQNETASNKGQLRIPPLEAFSPEDKQLAPFGLQRLDLDAERDALLYIPDTYRADSPNPLAVMLHGANGNAKHGIDLLRDLADSAGLILLAPASHYDTWDAIVDDYGPDVAILEQALVQTFRFYAIDPTRVAIGGFSDGASYALSLGLTNGDLFSHIIAFSPGFMAPAARRGAPQIYVSHGTQDDVLPIVRCSRHIVAQLRQAGYDVQYHEFEGPHTVPTKIAQQAVSWFTQEQD
jgi:phospholipase/carboxylesterase